MTVIYFFHLTFTKQPDKTLQRIKLLFCNNKNITKFLTDTKIISS